ncbi:uncharacterized protein LOC143357010 [Halictus rubicundus]|uniref:uncharacterized protein LOC143357010 n=1 Tax=Halictus rubicundus TaxID=77578 RepID=UPI0040367B69
MYEDRGIRVEGVKLGRHGALCTYERKFFVASCTVGGESSFPDVTRCQSGKGDIEKMSLFKTPNTSLFQEWAKVLSEVGVQLKKSHFVCEKHFNASDIKKQTIIKDATGKVIFQRNLKKISLSDSAVPCIFANRRLKRDIDDTENNGLHQDLTYNCDYFDESTRKSCISNIGSSNAKNCITYGCTDKTKSIPVMDITNFVEIRDKPQECPAIETPRINNTESDCSIEAQMANFFDYVYNTCHEIQFPSLAWNYHKTEFKNEIIFSEVKSGRDAAPIYQKQVVFSKNGEIKLFIYRKLCDFDIITPKSIQELNETLKMTDALTLCGGGPTCNVYYGGQPASAYIDDNDKWRHRLCTLVVSNREVCQFCYRLHNTLRRRLDRNTRSNKYRLLSPSKEKAPDTLKKSKRVQLQVIKRSKTKEEQLRCQMSNLQQQMQKLKSTKIYEKLKEYNTSGGQV